MDYTYDEILGRMEKKFFELSGYEADRVSDIGIRMRLLAGEIFSLSSNIDFVKKQMFPNTATGEYLELHAQQRGLERKKGNKSTGEIMLKLDTPLEYSLIIPKGTVCTTSDGTLNFLTTEDKAIAVGGSLALVEVEAENSGTQYNIAANKLTTIVTYFSAGLSISNSSSFIGGTDDETDDELRNRIIYSMKNIPNGANKQYYISLAKSVDGIQSAAVISKEEGPASITVYVGGRGTAASEEAYREAQSALRKNSATGITVYVKKANPVTVNVDISISFEGGYTLAGLQTVLTAKIKNFFDNLYVGERFALSALGDVIFHTDGVTDYVFNNMTDREISLKAMAVVGNINISQILPFIKE